MRELRQDWRDIFLGFRIALDAKKIILGAAGLVISLLWVAILSGVFSVFGLADNIDHNTVVDAVFRPPVDTAALKVVFDAPTSVPAWKAAYLSTTPGRFQEMLCGVVQNGLEVKEFVGLLIIGLGLLAIWSLIGGGITRIAAVELAKDERIELGESTNYSSSKFWSYFWSPLVPVLGVLFFGFWVAVVSVCGRIPAVGNLWILLCSLGFPLALLAGFLIVLIMIGGLFGLILMFPTISAEGTDAFDAISRAYSYVYSKPWRFIWYCLVALAYGVAVVAFVVCFSCYMTDTTLGLAEWAAGEDAFGGIRTYATQSLLGNDLATTGADAGFRQLPPFQGFLQKASGVIVFLWVFVVASLAYGFAVSFDCTAATIIYFLMRRAVDGTDMTEVYVEEEEEEPLPEPEAPAEEPEEEAPESGGEEEAPAEQEAEGEEDEDKKKK